MFLHNEPVEMLILCGQFKSEDGQEMCGHQCTCSTIDDTKIQPPRTTSKMKDVFLLLHLTTREVLGIWDTYRLFILRSFHVSQHDVKRWQRVRRVSEA